MVGSPAGASENSRRSTIGETGPRAPTGYPEWHASILFHGVEDDTRDSRIGQTDGRGMCCGFLRAERFSGGECERVSDALPSSGGSCERREPRSESDRQRGLGYGHQRAERHGGADTDRCRRHGYPAPSSSWISEHGVSDREMLPAESRKLPYAASQGAVLFAVCSGAPTGNPVRRCRGGRCAVTREQPLTTRVSGPRPKRPSDSHRGRFPARVSRPIHSAVETSHSRSPRTHARRASPVDRGPDHSAASVDRPRTSPTSRPRHNESLTMRTQWRWRESGANSSPWRTARTLAFSPCDANQRPLPRRRGAMSAATASRIGSAR